MAFDPAVISQISENAPDPLKATERAYTLKDMVDRNQLNQLQVGAAKTEAADTGKVKEILKGSDYSTPEGLASTVAKVNRVSPKSAMELMKQGQQYQSGQVQQQLDQLELADKRQGLIVNAIDPIVAQARQMKNGGASDLEVNAFISKSFPGMLQSMRSQRLADGKPALSDELLQQVVQGKQDLSTLENYEMRSKSGQQMIRQRLDEFKAETQSRHENETERHNQAMEENAGRRTDIADRKGGTFTPEMGELLGALAEDNVSLPAGFRSKEQQIATLGALLTAHPDKTPQEISGLIRSGKLKLTAETKGAQTAGTQIGKVALAANELDSFGPQVLEASAGVPRGGFVPFNQLRNLENSKLTSKPELLRFKAKMQALENAYNQLAARSGTDVDKRAHIHELFNTANSPEAVAELVRSLKEEAVAARQAANATIAETSGSSIPGAQNPGGGVTPPGQASPSAGGGAPSSGPAKTIHWDDLK